jgi:nucleoside-triphosphatase THEP1
MKLYPKKQLSEKWLKASVVGSLWATVEIVLGSLLHNLKLPLAGSVLSFITVYLVISFFQVWKTHGLIWRAGLICALMKSISPSAIILGPMIGILSQAIILDVIIRLSGSNLFSYSVGGALAVLSALLQKALTLLILYGWDFVLLLENMYFFAIRQLRLEYLPPAWLLVLLSFVYLFSGALAGFMGFLTGRNYLKVHADSPAYHTVETHVQSDLFKHTRKNNHSILLLLLSFVLLLTGMLMISQAELWVSAILVLMAVVLGYLRYPSNMRYFRKPALWIQLGIIILLSAIFKNGLEHVLTIEGFSIGLKMSLRALLMLACFAAISAELKNPVVKNLLYNRGFQNLYQSVELAFSALPGIMEEFYGQTRDIKGFKKLAFAMLSRSQSLLDAFRKTEENRKPLFVLTGRINQGKTSFTLQLIEMLQNQGLTVRGFVTMGNTNDSYRNAYKIKNLQSGEETALCSTQPDLAKPNYGRFYFEESGIEKGCNIIAQTLTQPADLLVIDELGPMEINNRGWAPAVESVVKENSTAQFWVVREKLVKPMMRKWNVGDIVVFELGADSADYIAETITGMLKIKSS